MRKFEMPAPRRLAPWKAGRRDTVWQRQRRDRSVAEVLVACGGACAMWMLGWGCFAAMRAAASAAGMLP